MPDQITFDLPWPPSLNSYYRAFRGFIRISKAGRQYTDAVAQAVWERFGTVKPIDQPLAVRIDYHAPDRRKRDLDNYQKAPLDALTKCGFWADDSLLDWVLLRRCEVIGRPGKIVVTVAVIEAARELEEKCTVF